MRLNSNSAESNRVRAHLTLLGLTKVQVNAILAQVHSWEKQNKHEWTVKRIKSLKTWFLQHLAGNTDYKEDWFKLRRSNNGFMIPQGPFGFLFENTHLPDKKIIQSLSVLMSYTAYKLKRVSKAQVIKTVGSIQGVPLDNEINEDLKSFSMPMAKRMTKENSMSIKGYLKKRSSRFTMNPAGLNTGKPFGQDGDRYLQSFLQGLYTPKLRAYLAKHFKDFPSDAKFPCDLECYSEGSIEGMPLSGVINIIQERGAKARVIANPTSSAQVALYPLHQLLNDILKDTSTDCTHDQDSGALWAHQKLNQGHPVYSVDLSGATDNFPRSLQIALLDTLGLSTEGELIEALAKGTWVLSKKLKFGAQKQGFLEATSYTRGQPQGLYSSFPLFALTHNLIVKVLCDEVGCDPEDSFRILGDDIVISDKSLHSKYREFLEYAGVPISEDKSLQSSSIAEFAGFLITRNGYYKPAKVPNYGSLDAIENNFMSYLNVVGEKGIKLLPSKVRSVAKRAASLPQELGGLGFNSQGLSLEDRTSHFLSQNDLTLAEVPRYFDTKSSFLKQWISSKSVRTHSTDEILVLEWLNDQFSSYDSYANSVICSYPSLLNMGLANISDVHTLAFQVSQLGVQGRAMRGNRSPDVTGDKPFKTDFEIWRDRFVDLRKSDVMKLFGGTVSIPYHTNKKLRVRLRPKARSKVNVK